MFCFSSGFFLLLLLSFFVFVCLLFSLSPIKKLINHFKIIIGGGVLNFDYCCIYKDTYSSVTLNCAQEFVLVMCISIYITETRELCEVSIQMEYPFFSFKKKKKLQWALGVRCNKYRVI